MRHLLSLLLVLVMVVALAAPAMAASPSVVENVEEETTEEESKEESKKDNSEDKETEDDTTAETAAEAAAYMVIADPAAKDAAIAEIFNGAESINVNGTEFAAADIVLAGKVSGNEVALAQTKDGDIVPVTFSAAGVTEPGLSMTQDEFLAKYAVIVMVNGVPTPIEQIPGASIEMENGVIKANMPFGFNFAIIAK